MMTNRPPNASRRLSYETSLSFNAQVSFGRWGVDYAEIVKRKPPYLLTKWLRLLQRQYIVSALGGKTILSHRDYTSSNCYGYMELENQL